MGGTEEEGGRDSRMEGDASERVRPRSQGGGKAGGAPVRRAGRLFPHLSQPTAS